MKISTKMLAVTAAIGIIGLAGFSRLASANQGQSATASPSFSSLPTSSTTTANQGKSVTTLSQNQKTAGVKDDDGEADDKNEKEANDENEKGDGDGETNDDRK
jgi:hypothetical protein